MIDWLGLTFFVLLIVGAIVGLKVLARPRHTTGDEFERNVAESASMLSASMNALSEMLNPEASKSKEVQTQLKQGRYNKKKREGKAAGDAANIDN